MSFEKEIAEREGRLIDFLSDYDNEVKRQEDIDAFNNSPEIKQNIINNGRKEGVSVALDKIFTNVYRNALPLNDPKRSCSDGELCDEIKNFIKRRTEGKSTEWYVREGIKRTQSPALKNLLKEATRITNEFYSEKAKDIGTVSIEDLNFNKNINTEEIDNITKKLELDDVADMIQNNVIDALNDEKKRAAAEEEYNKKVEDSLIEDPEVHDDETMEATLDNIKKKNGPAEIYQPSLMEAILTSNLRKFPADKAFTESVSEYTLLSISKALKLENFDVMKTRKLANSYLI